MLNCKKVINQCRCLGNLSSTTKPNFNVTHASLPDLSTCGVSCLADQVDSVVENVVPKIPSYGLREFQQRFEELRRENFSLKVSLSYAQLKLRELGKQLVEKEIAFAKARKEWDKEILIRDEKYCPCEKSREWLKEF
ncbi:Centrosomin, partial [Trichinella spiralis]